MPTWAWYGLAAAIALLEWFVLVDRGALLSAIEHKPDLNNLPIYPGAQHLSTRDKVWIIAKADNNGTAHETGTTVMGKITDYQTNATPEEVLAFYKKAMPEYGWPAPDTLNDGNLQFIYVQVDWLTGSVKGPLVVTIKATSAGNGMTSVELSTGL